MSEQPEQPGTHHFILTVQKPDASGGASLNTFHGDLTLPSGTTRSAAYAWIRDEHDRRNPHMAGGVVLFFALESNTL